MEEKQLLRNLLKKTFSKNCSKEDTSNDIDTQLSSASLRYITERIEFKPAVRPDSYLEHLKNKYTPINANYKPMASSPTLLESDESCKSAKSHDANAKSHDDGIPSPKRVLYDPEKIQMKWSRVRGVGTGLANMGNTCFLNSVIQCLSYSSPLHNFLISGQHKTSCELACSSERVNE